MELAILALCAVVGYGLHLAVTRPLCRRLGWA